MSNYHLYHISFFDSLLKGLKSNGVSIDKLTQNSYLKRFDLNCPNTYIPIEVGYEFFDKVKHSQSVDCISSEFYGGFQVADLSEYGQFLSNCPDLYSILMNAVKYDYLIQTSGRVRLKTEGALTWFSMKHTDAPSPGRLVSERINLAMFFKAFQFILGSEWIPMEINITSSDGYWIKSLLPSFDFKLNTNCPEIAVCFKTKDLAAKNNKYIGNSTIDHKDLKSIEAVTIEVFNSLDKNYIPTLDEFSEYFGFSKRTIIRGFASAGTSYKEILEKHQFIRALSLMEDYTLAIRDISSLLGYANTSNFIRAFKSWTSSTPNQYRLQVSNF